MNVIDVTDILSLETYKPIQTRYYYSDGKDTIIVAQRTSKSDEVFEKRSLGYADIMVMFRGAYNTFTETGFKSESIKQEVKKMIEMRIKNEEYGGTDVNQ